MTAKAQRSVFIKWVRSGIGFPYTQKEMVRSLGLRRLNQVVKRPDTPQIRGLVTRIPHLVEIVDEPEKPEWLSAPEYTLHPGEVERPEAVARPQRKVKKTVAAEAAVHASRQEAEAKAAKAAPAHEAKAKKAAKSAAVPKEKAKVAKAEAEKKKAKAAHVKAEKPSKKGKK